MSEFDSEIYTRLPLESRLYALGLCPPTRGVGRPRRLDYQRRLEVYVAWWNALNGHAVHLHDRKRDRAVAKLQAKFRTLSAAAAPTHEITGAIDKIGRATRVPIEPPPTCYPELDRAIAEQFGISERMVRRIRTDHRLKKFRPHPAWHERPWERPVREAFQARQVAERLMTRMRYAKGEAVALERGRLVVLDTAGRLNQRGLLSDSALHRYRDFERRAVKAGIPFRTGSELEIIPGPAPRHRVGGENTNSEGFGIGLPTKPAGIGSPRPSAGCVYRWIPGWGWGLFARPIVESKAPEPSDPLEPLRSWEELKSGWRRHRAEFEQDRCTHLEFWLRAEREWPRWEAVDPQRMPWGILAKMEDVALLVEKMWTPLGRAYYRVTFLRDLIALYRGTIARCPTFAHALPDGWVTAARPEPQKVLGPHSTWPYMATPLYSPLTRSHDEVAYRQIRALRAWLEAGGHFGQKTESEARCDIMTVGHPPK